MGVRQSMGLFLSPLNTATGLGVASISLAFAFGQLWWGLTQPFAGAMADRIGAGRVLIAGALLVALGTFITPFMTTTGASSSPSASSPRAARAWQAPRC
jgi:MFS family permease